MMGFGDAAFALNMRDTIMEITKNQIDKLRPRYKYATVTNINRATRKCSVVFTGETVSVTINMGAIQPASVGQVVRVEGIGTDKYITDVLGEAFVAAKSEAAVPVGGIISMAGVTIPAGKWLLCDGRAVSRVDYTELFDAIGTTYGAGNGSTTFNLPNMKGRVPVGIDTSQAEFNAANKTGGAKTHTLTEAEMPSHTHVQNSHNHAQNAHSHTQDAHNHGGVAHNHSQDSHNHSGVAHNHGQTAHSHAADNGSLGWRGNEFASGTKAGIYSDAAYPRTTGTATAGISAATAGNNATTASNNAATAGNVAATATNQSTTASNAATTATNQSTGGGEAHNNLQPYITMNYFIAH